MANPDWFSPAFGWDPNRLGDAPTNPKYAIAKYAMDNNINFNAPERNLGTRIFDALHGQFPGLSLVNPDTIDLGNGDGTIGVRPNDRGTNWDARQGPWNLSWISPYTSNEQSNSYRLTHGMPAWPNIPTSLSMPRASATPPQIPPVTSVNDALEPFRPRNGGVSGYGPGGKEVPAIGSENPYRRFARNEKGDRATPDDIVEQVLQALLMGAI